MCPIPVLSQTMSLVAVSASLGSYQFMSSMSRPTYNQGTLVDSGVDLNMEAGMAELAYCPFCHLVSLCLSFSVCLSFYIIYVARSHKMVHKSILGATEILIFSERGENADYYGEKIIMVSVKLKKLWRVKVSGGESSHFEKNQFKVVQRILGIFP